MIISTKLNGNALHLHGDSIETSEILVEGSLTIPAGTTSQNEQVIPQIIDGSRYQIYQEKVCKIGILSDRISCSVAGSADLAYEILEMLSHNISSIKSLKELSENLKTIRKNLVGATKFLNDSCVLLMNCNFDTLYVCGVFCDVRDDGNVKFQFKNCPIEHDGHWQFTEGSGIEFMKDFFPGSVLELLQSDPTTESITTELLAYDYSDRIRFKSRGIANGVGGAVFGLKMTRDGISYMQDTMFLYADYRKSLEVAVKVIYRQGMFIVTDFIKKSVTAMRTLESELAFRRNPSSEILDITALIKDAFSFQSTLTVVDSREPGSPFTPNVGIVENANGCVGAVSFNVEFADGLPFLPQGTELKLKTQDVNYEFVVRLP
jgi:hypothetical protein